MIKLTEEGWIKSHRHTSRAGVKWNDKEDYDLYVSGAYLALHTLAWKHERTQEAVLERLEVCKAGHERHFKSLCTPEIEHSAHWYEIERNKSLESYRGPPTQGAKPHDNLMHAFPYLFQNEDGTYQVHDFATDTVIEDGFCTYDAAVTYLKVIQATRRYAAKHREIYSK